MRTPTRFAFSPTLGAAVVLALAAALAPVLAEAQAPGTIIIEGTLTFGGSAAPTPPAAPPPVAPPIVLVAPAPQVIAAASPPAPIVAALPSAPPAGAGVAPLAPTPPGEASAEPPRTRRRWGLVGAGAGIAIGAYALNLVGSLLWMAIPTGVASTAFLVPTWNGHREELLLWSLVPVAGPLVQIGYAEAEWQIPLFVAASALEVAGFIMAIVGTASRERVAPAPGARVAVVPYASSTGGGLSAMGTF